MRTYKYPIRTHPKTKRLGNMLDDLADLKRHILTLEQRYYRRYGKYLGRYRLQPLGTLLSMKHKPKSLDFGHYDDKHSCQLSVIG